MHLVVKAGRGISPEGAPWVWASLSLADSWQLSHLPRSVWAIARQGTPPSSDERGR